MRSHFTRDEIVAAADIVKQHDFQLWEELVAFELDGDQLDETEWRKKNIDIQYRIREIIRKFGGRPNHIDAEHIAHFVRTVCRLENSLPIRNKDFRLPE